jgi:hypothetical protein
MSDIGKNNPPPVVNPSIAKPGTIATPAKPVKVPGS